MIGHIVKSVFLSIIIAILASVVVGFAYGIVEMVKMNWSSILIILLPAYVYVWLTTKILNLVGRKMSFCYWFVCFIFALIILILSLNNGISFGETDVNFYHYYIWHFSIMMFLIPETDGYWTTYLNTEITIDGDGDVLDSVSWISREYTSGVTIKLVAVLILSLMNYLKCFLKKDLI